MTDKKEPVVTLTVDLDQLELAEGSHPEPEPGEPVEACVMEVVALVSGEPWSDHPACVSPVIATFLRQWNDRLPDEDRQQLKRWIRPVIGTNTHPADDETRAWMACDWLVRVHTPAWLRLAGLVDQADQLAGMPELRPDTVPTIRPALDAIGKDAAAAWDAAGDAAGDAARDAARAGAWDAAGAAAWAAAWDAAGDAVRDAVRAAVRAGAWDAVRAAAWAAAWDAAGDAVRDAAGDAAWAAAWDAAGERLAPTVADLQASAHELIDRMVAVGRKRSV